MHINADDILSNASANLQAGDQVTVSVVRGEETTLSWEVTMDEDGVIVLSEDIEEE